VDRGKGNITEGPMSQRAMEV